MNNFKNIQRKEIFYTHNEEIFLQYFDSIESYRALINAGNIKKLESLIAENGGWTCDESIAYIQSIFN